MYESKIYPSKHQVLVWELEEVVKSLRNSDFDQSVSDMGNYAAHKAADMIESAMKKSEEPIHG